MARSNNAGMESGLKSLATSVTRHGWVLALLCTVACASHTPPNVAPAITSQADLRTILHVLNRTSFGPTPGDLERVQRFGLSAYIDEQLHPERLADDAVEVRLAALHGLEVTAREFAVSFYQPMIAARQQFTNTQKGPVGARLPILRGHLLPIAAASLPAEGRPTAIIQQPPLTLDEVVLQRKNQEVFEALQAQKLLRAVYSERQLQEVLTDFWFNHFNVDATKIEDRPVLVEYERAAIRPYVLGKFRDLLGATAHSPAMLFYLDNWMSAAPPSPPKQPVQKGAPPPRLVAGRGLNENYGRELLELHTLGVNGGYTQHDVVEVARCFTGWTMRNPHDGLGFIFDDTKHDHGEKRVLGHRIKAGRGIDDGEEVLDLLARHPSTARFIATKLVRRFVSDDPPPALVERVARTFRHTDGDLREVMRAILTSPEFLSADAYRAKVKSPLEYVASVARATAADITNVRVFINIIANLGEPLYQCQPPTGYGDRAATWMNTGALVTRLNFALAVGANGVNASRVDAAKTPRALSRMPTAIFADDVSPATRAAAESPQATVATRVGLLLGSPEFQRR